MNSLFLLSPLPSKITVFKTYEGMYTSFNILGITSFDYKYLLYHYDGKLIGIKSNLCELIFVHLITKSAWIIPSPVIVWRGCTVYV